MNLDWIVGVVLLIVAWSLGYSRGWSAHSRKVRKERAERFSGENKA